MLNNPTFTGALSFLIHEDGYGYPNAKNWDELFDIISSENYPNAKNWGESIDIVNNGNDEKERFVYIIKTENDNIYEFNVPLDVEKTFVSYEHKGEMKTVWFFGEWQKKTFKEFYKKYKKNE